MNKLEELWNKGLKWCSKHSMGILTGGSLIGLGTTVILVRKAAMEEQRIISENPPKDWKEHLKLTWKCYTWAAGSLIGTTACVIAHEKVSEKKIKGVTLAFEASQAAASMYKDKVKEALGERKEDKIHEEVAKDQIKNVVINNIYGHPEDGSLWMINLTGDAFYGDEAEIRNALADVSDELQRYDFCELEVFINGLKKGIKTGKIAETIGWSTSKTGSIRIPYKKRSVMYDPGNGRTIPCGVIEFDISLMTTAYHDDITLM